MAMLFPRLKDFPQGPWHPLDFRPLSAGLTTNHISSFIRRRFLITFFPNNKNPAKKDRKGLDRSNGLVYNLQA
jgi:hypothetical protein